MSDDKPIIASRRGVLGGGVAVLAAAITARSAAADEKMAQSVVQYQATPNDGAKCSDCVNFVAPDGCKIVEGKIAPTGWCVAFAPKG